MVLGTVGFKVYENFSVIDETGTLASGIDINEFNVDVFNPAGAEVSNSTIVSISELGNGHYRIEFTPDQVGTWYIVVYHYQYFPWGKSDDVQVYTSDISRIASELGRVLGLTQENYYLDNTIYTEYQGAQLLTSGRIRIYSNDADVGTDNSVIDTYQVTSTWDGNELSTYKVIKV